MEMAFSQTHPLHIRVFASTLSAKSPTSRNGIPRPKRATPYSNRISATVGAFGSRVLAFAIAPSFSFLNQ